MSTPTITMEEALNITNEEPYTYMIRLFNGPEKLEHGYPQYLGLQDDVNDGRPAHMSRIIAYIEDEEIPVLSVKEAQELLDRVPGLELRFDEIEKDTTKTEPIGEVHYVNHRQYGNRLYAYVAIKGDSL